jgi:toxin ParE1/3/4
MILDFHPAAVEELIEAARYYEQKGKGLGHGFLDSVDAALATLQRNPALGRADQRGRRRWLIRRFPFLIIYRIQRPSLHILALAHTSRRPNYWKSRDTAGL